MSDPNTDTPTMPPGVEFQDTGSPANINRPTTPEIDAILEAGGQSGVGDVDIDRTAIQEEAPDGP